MAGRRRRHAVAQALPGAPWTAEDCAKQLKSNSGKQFDRRIASLALELVSKPPLKCGHRVKRLGDPVNPHLKKTAIYMTRKMTAWMAFVP